jgi:hypothetical protein
VTVREQRRHGWCDAVGVDQPMRQADGLRHHNGEPKRAQAHPGSIASSSPAAALE